VGKRQVRSLISRSLHFLIGCAVAGLLCIQFAPYSLAQGNNSRPLDQCRTAWEGVVEQKPLLSGKLCSFAVHAAHDVSVKVARLAGPRSRFLVSSLVNYRLLYAGSDILLKATENQQVFKLGAAIEGGGDYIYVIDGVYSYAYLTEDNAHWVRCTERYKTCVFYAELVSEPIMDAYGIPRYCEVFLMFRFPSTDLGDEISIYMSEIIEVASGLQRENVDVLMKACR